MMSLDNVMGIIRRWKFSIISLGLRFLEIPHKNIWVSWGVPFKSLGAQNGSQMLAKIMLSSKNTQIGHGMYHKSDLILE